METQKQEKTICFAGIEVTINGEDQPVVKDYYGTEEETNSKEGGRFFLPRKVSDVMAGYKTPAYKISYLSEGADLRFWDVTWKNNFIIDGKTYRVDGSTISAKGIGSISSDEEMDGNGTYSENQSKIYKNCTNKILYSLYNYVIPYKNVYV